MTMKKIAAEWAEHIESLNGRPVTLDDVAEFCRTQATSYEEFNAMYELLSDQVDEEEDCEVPKEEYEFNPYVWSAYVRSLRD